MEIINPESIHLYDKEDMESLVDVCALAYVYAKDFSIAGFAEQRRQRALRFAQRIWEMHIKFIEHEAQS